MATKQNTVVSLRVPNWLLKAIDKLAEENMTCRSHAALLLIKNSVMPKDARKGKES